jgi:tetratricopeptide (TPR) repeat protein
MGELYVRMGKLDLAEAKYREALELKPDFFTSCAGLAYVSCLREDYAGASRWFGEFIARAPTPAAKVEGYWWQAAFDYLLGRWDASLAAYAAIRKQAEAGGVAYLVATVDWATGFIHRDRGDFDDALKGFQGMIDYLTGARSDKRADTGARGAFLRGWVELGRGRTAGAAARLAEIEPLLSQDDPAGAAHTMLLYRLLRAEVALAEGDLDRAVTFGREIVFEPFPAMNTPDLADYNLPFLKDVLARAYWKKGDLDAAVSEYRKLTTIDPANQVRMFIHPLYHYRLGRVLEDKGDKAGAAAEYRKFLDYWKDADPSRPEPADARKRLAAL